MKAYVRTVGGDYEIDHVGGLTHLKDDVVAIVKPNATNKPSEVLAIVKLSDNTFVFLGDAPPTKIDL